MAKPKVAEFFAGSGLVRKSFEREGFRVVFANDIDVTKFKIYSANFGATEFVHRSIEHISGDEIPSVEIATASFPCTDLSLAGARSGLRGRESRLLWEFTRVLSEMEDRRPPFLMIENVPGFLTSHGGRDLSSAIKTLNDLEYSCDLLILDARWFVPQSRPRLFVIGSRLPVEGITDPEAGKLRPQKIIDFINAHPQLKFHFFELPEPETANVCFASAVQRFHPKNRIWWDQSRLDAFLTSLSTIQSKRLKSLCASNHLTWSTAFRRTRNGTPVWEIRSDGIGGCLRTSRGGSSRQAVVEAGRNRVRVRWMTATEYARLQGADDFSFGTLTESQAKFALGDAVCVPAVQWLAREYLMPLVRSERDLVIADVC